MAACEAGGDGGRARLRPERVVASSSSSPTFAWLSPLAWGDTSLHWTARQNRPSPHHVLALAQLAAGSRRDPRVPNRRGTAGFSSSRPPREGRGVIALGRARGRASHACSGCPPPGSLTACSSRSSSGRRWALPAPGLAPCPRLPPAGVGRSRPLIAGAVLLSPGTPEPRPHPLAAGGGSGRRIRRMARGDTAGCARGRPIARLPPGRVLFLRSAVRSRLIAPIVWRNRTATSPPSHPHRDGTRDQSKRHLHAFLRPSRPGLHRLGREPSHHHARRKRAMEREPSRPGRSSRARAEKLPDVGRKQARDLRLVVASRRGYGATSASSSRRHDFTAHPGRSAPYPRSTSHAVSADPSRCAWLPRPGG
jgi:hypothetical protein